MDKLLINVRINPNKTNGLNCRNMNSKFSAL